MDLSLISLIATSILVASSFCSLILYYQLRQIFVIRWRYHCSTDVDHPRLYLKDLRHMRKTLVFSIGSSSLLLSLIVLQFFGAWKVPLPMAWSIFACVFLVIALRSLRSHDHTYTPKL
ncbi:MAG: hypothetical protein AAB631_01645 [Patescibacteria group bacterium]